MGLLTSRTILCFVAAGLVSELVYWVYKKLRRPSKSNKLRFKSEVLFFPDETVACKEYFTATLGCQRLTCGFSHEMSSLGRLYQCLANARRSIDVCVYVLTCNTLADVLIDAVNKGLCVRLITDCEQMQQEASEVWRLRSEGIHVRHDESSFFMHHKFAIIDNQRLINGSFNWTRQAISGNQENLVITEEVSVVTAFRKEFSALWEKFDPQNKKKLPVCET